MLKTVRPTYAGCSGAHVFSLCLPVCEKVSIIDGMCVCMCLFVCQQVGLCVWFVCVFGWSECE